MSDERKADASPMIECPSCLGYGFFDEVGMPTVDRRGRKCLDCTGTGWVVGGDSGDPRPQQ